MSFVALIGKYLICQFIVSDKHRIQS